MSPRQSDAKLILELFGHEAERGLPLHNLESFIDQFIRGLRAFDRVRRGVPPLKAGQPGKRGSAVAAFRVVGFRVGSALMTLEPIKEDETDQLFPGEGTLAIENLHALLDDLEKECVLDSDVLDALDRARSSLGQGGGFNVAEVEDGDVRRRVAVDEARISTLRERATRREPNLVRISGRLHMIDLEPPLKVGIRSTDGIDWICRYNHELESKVKALLDSNVWVSGTGTLTGAQRGTLDIDDIRPISGFEQSPLFTLEHVSVQDLIAQQGIRGPQGEEALGLPTEVTDEELENYLNALLDD